MPSEHGKNIQRYRKSLVVMMIIDDYNVWRSALQDNTLSIITQTGPILQY